MMEYLQQGWDFVSYYYMQAAHFGVVEWFIVSALVFMPLAFIAPSNPSQPLIHKGMLPDIFYWFFGSPLLYMPVGIIIGRGLLAALLITGIYSAATINNLGRYGVQAVAGLPVLLQAFLILLIMDIIQYWTHRMFHTMKFWKFHAIHHSAVNVDWLTAARFHPVNIIIHSTCVGALVYTIGFSPEAWAILAPFNTIYSPLVHANVNWTYGPFRYLLASPVFHRWHHTHMSEGGGKNFAPTFPLLDIIFGTYYDPKDKKPTVCGTEYDDIAENVFAQLAYPFIRKPKIIAGEINGEV